MSETADDVEAAATSDAADTGDGAHTDDTADDGGPAVQCEESEDRADAHLADIDDGCGCAEVWEHLSDQRGE